MIHIKTSLHTQKRHKKIRRNAKGYRGVSKGNLRTIMQRTEKALQYSYSHRRSKKRDFRNLWIHRINAGAREHGITYSQLMHGLSKTEIRINRKMLSDLAVNEPLSFKALVDQIKSSSIR
jgi:large subunit ribosomal protein L20